VEGFSSTDLLFALVMAWFVIWCFRAGMKDGNA
jgi:hypothetical protein